MKVSMMQAITVMNTKPEFDDSMPPHCIKNSRKAIAIREKCLELIKSGERCLTVLSAELDVHRTTLIGYLRELRDNGFIEFTTKGGAKIVNVL